ncbi:hypothetical protein Tcan_02331, partial [Toxocara canis]
QERDKSDWSTSRSHEGVEWVLSEDATERPLLDDDELDAVRRSLNDVPISTSSSGLPLLECSSAHNSSPSADVTPPPPLPSKYIVRDEMTEWIHAKGDSCVTLSSYGQERIRVNEIPPAHHETNPFATKSFEIFPQQPFVAHSLHQVQPNAVSSSRGIGESDPVAPGPAGIYKSASTLPSSGVPHSECTSELAINAAASDRADALPRQPKRFIFFRSLYNAFVLIYSNLIRREMPFSTLVQH